MSGKIKVLSYNTSWESSEPKPNWNENVNFYEPERTEAATMVASEADELGFDDEGNLTNREEQPDWKEKRVYTNEMLSSRDKADEFGDGEDGISYHANKNPEEVRTNIFNIIKSGNYDLVGMQEYVHKIYDKNNYGKAIEDVYAQPQYIPSLTNMKLVIGDVPLNLPNGQIKTIRLSDEEKAERQLRWLRKERDKLLRASDWTQFNDVTLDSDKKTEWATYRQALRDITISFSSVSDENFAWPTKPE